MQWSKLSQLALPSLIATAALQALSSPVQAALLSSESEGRIVINDTAGQTTARAIGAPFTAVTELFIGNALCSGTLISPTTVITAKHCTDGASPGAMSVRFRDSDSANSLLFTRGVSSKFEVPPVPQTSLLDGTDVSLLTLDSPVTTIAPLRFLADNPTGVTATMVGFGLNGVGSTGHQNTRDSLRWGAENVIDLYGPAASFPPTGTTVAGSANIFNTDFDNGTRLRNTLAGFGSSAVPLTNEGTTAPGDSGGPLLVNLNGEFLIVGVLSGGTSSTSQYGDISWWTGTNQHRSFIEAQGGQFVPIPEPLTILGAGTAIGFGTFFKLRLAKRNKKDNGQSQ